ncbi:MAG: hypothetical protein AAGC55_16690, partial [Myxococcota bacterium]
MKKHPSPSVEELLAAYADGGGDAAERADVERFLADDPAARRDLAEIDRLIGLTRTLAPRPEVEPDWSRMAADIERACDQVADALP